MAQKRKRYAIRVPQPHKVSASVPRVRRLEMKGEREKEWDEICGCTIAEKEIPLGGIFWMSCLDQFDGYPSGCDVFYGNCSLLSFSSRLNICLPFSYQSLTENELFNFSLFALISSIKFSLFFQNSPHRLTSPTIICPPSYGDGRTVLA